MDCSHPYGCHEILGISFSSVGLDFGVAMPRKKRGSERESALFTADVGSLSPRGGLMVFQTCFSSKPPKSASMQAARLSQLKLPHHPLAAIEASASRKAMYPLCPLYKEDYTKRGGCLGTLSGQNTSPQHPRQAVQGGASWPWSCDSTQPNCRLVRNPNRNTLNTQSPYLKLNFGLGI